MNLNDESKGGHYIKIKIKLYDEKSDSPELLCDKPEKSWWIDLQWCVKVGTKEQLSYNVDLSYGSKTAKKNSGKIFSQEYLYF